jgi:hypothetical protein
MKEKTQKETAEPIFSLLWKFSLFRGPDCYKLITQNRPQNIKIFKAKPPMATLKKTDKKFVLKVVFHIL